MNALRVRQNGVRFEIIPKDKTNSNRNGTMTDAIDITSFFQETLTLFVNIALLLLILSQKALIKQKSNQLIVNLLCVHVLLAIAGIVAKFSFPYESAVVNNGFLMEMVFSMVITTGERHVKIKYPYLHESFTKRTVICLITASWFLSAVFVTLSLVLQISTYQITAICTALILLATAALATSNVHLYMIARRHVVAAWRQTVRVRPSAKKQWKMLKCAYVCFSIVFSFIVLWLPLFVHNVMVLVDAYKPSGSKLFTKVVLNVAAMKSLIDPILYLCFSKDAKREVRKLLRM